MFIAKKNEKVFLYEKITNTRNISVIEKEENNEEIEEKHQEKTQQEDELCYNEKKKKWFYNRWRYKWINYLRNFLDRLWLHL